MDKKNIAIAYAEIWEILKHTQDEIIERIPSDLLKRIENERDKNCTFKCDLSKGLAEQDITDLTKSLLSNIYREYLITPEERETLRKADELEEKRSRLKKYESMLDEENI